MLVALSLRLLLSSVETACVLSFSFSRLGGPCRAAAAA